MHFNNCNGWFSFLLAYFFARRGCEDFDHVQETYCNTNRPIWKKVHFTEKRRENDAESGSNDRIYETGSAKCHVKLIETYLNKLHMKNIFLGKRTKPSFKCDELFVSSFDFISKRKMSQAFI